MSDTGRAVDAFAADQPQPRCNICGRFAYRETFTDENGKEHKGRWRLSCVTEVDNGVYEHN